MTQGLVGLPESADIKIGDCEIEIRNHKLTNDAGLFGKMLEVIQLSNSDRYTLAEFEDHQISFETAIECCANELEDNIWVMALAMFYKYGICEIIDADEENGRAVAYIYSKGDTGRQVAHQIIEKIRDCANWTELYDTLHQDSKFQKKTRKRIKEEIKQWYKV